MNLRFFHSSSAVPSLFALCQVVTAGLLKNSFCRDDINLQVSGLERTRSGWVKGLEEGTSLRSLHIAQTPHMGVSIPAVAYPLKADGTADLDVKPQPVTLFFGIIDFLQVRLYHKLGEAFCKIRRERKCLSQVPFPINSALLQAFPTLSNETLIVQLYNLRKWSEHQLKSIVQDGKKISVTNPKAYARRFTRHMQTLFIPIPGQ